MKTPQRPTKKPIEAGTHRAICYAVADLGTQRIQYPGRPAQDVRQLLIQWELPDMRIEFEENGQTVSKPKVIGNKYTFSLFSGANLYKHLSSWLGTIKEDDSDFEYESLLQKPCLLNITHKKSKSSDKMYAMVSSVIQLPTGMASSEMENPPLFYDLEEHGQNWPESMIGDNYKWLRELISLCHEFNGYDDTEPTLSDEFKEQYDIDESEVPF